VTLTGPGGVGKTRLALAVGERAGGRFGSGAVFVPLAGVTAPELVVAGIGRAVGADLVGTGAPLQALAEQLGDGAWLLILDNLEQVIDAARDLDELLARCPGVVIMATSRTVLGLRAEREYPVPPLPLPAGPATMAPQELTASPAVALFVDRARAVWPDFALSVGLVETAVGRYDDALGHLTEVRDLAERSDNSWIGAMSRVGLGTLALVRGRAEEARALLDEALGLSLAARSTRSVTMCLAALARWALVAGDPERAALVAGAAEGLRRRAGLRAWPILRQGESDLVAQVRDALGADHFDQVFAIGTRLSQRDAVTAARAGTAPAPG
jgi:hypothetical protein